MNRSRPPAVVEEQLIGALIPVVLPGPQPAPSPLPALAPLTLPSATADGVLLDLARLDASGRLSARGLLRALGWPAGHRLTMDATGGAVIIGSSPAGRWAVGNRGDVALPSALRSMCGLTAAAPVVLLASVQEDRLVVHPAATVVRLLAEHHARAAGVAHGGS